MNKEVELCSHSELDCPMLQVSTVFVVVVFCILCGFVAYRTIERASCGTRKLLCTGVVPPTMSVSQCGHVVLTLVLAVPADGALGQPVFSHSYPIPPFPPPAYYTGIWYMVFVDVKP